MTAGVGLDAGRAPALRVDLRRAPLAEIRAVDLRSPDRDFWADEAAAWDRLEASWAGLDDAAWRLPGAARSDAGGPDWSLLDHIGHLVDWYEIAHDYIGIAVDTGRWPSDDDYDGGDFDTWNEHRRPRFADVPPAELRVRAAASHERLVRRARTVPLATIRADRAWGWVHMVLGGHAIDHLVVLEPWADRLRARQLENDPFGPDPQPAPATLVSAIERFWSDDAAVAGLFDTTVRSAPRTAWRRGDVSGGWTLADHVGHLARWFEEGAAALEGHAATGRWQAMPAEGLDIFNARSVGELRALSVDAIVARHDAGLERLRAAIRAMTDAEWLDPEGFSWAYEDLHGHVRAHLAMVGPWCARIGWPGTRG